MERFYRKKCCYAVLFCVLLSLFCIVNWKQQLGSIVEVFQETEIESISDVSGLIAEVEDTIADEMAGRMCFIEGYGYLQRLLGKRESNNFSYIQDKQDMLQHASFYREEDPLVPEYAKRIRRLKEYVEPYGTKVLFVAPPGKYIPGESNMYAGMPINDANKIQDEFLYELKKNQVDVLDLRTYFDNTDDITYEEMFYKTDHHWTTRAALLATFQIVDEIDRRYGENWDPDGYYRDIGNYNIKEYKQCMLGSMGRNTGITFSGLDDFELIWPKENGEYEFTAQKDSGRDIEQSGSFEESFFYESNLTNTDPYDDSRYSIYLSGINVYDHVINQQNPDGPKVLILKDSYFSPVIAFLSPMCGEIEAFWTKDTEDKVDIEQHIRENRYDYILVEVYPYNIEDASIPYFKAE
ncbi:MAG: hypothetical protein GX234_04765 [Clostridiales bacterium]|nr:hypothetical protein [Clostridiales bacterium]